jgi:serine/threonine-protein kinase
MTQPIVIFNEPPELPSRVRIGDVVEGKYRLDRIIASGGMGVLVKATHLQLGQPIAIKFMSPRVGENESGVRRFLLEARAAALLRSEHVVRVFDVASLPQGAPYIVMEYLEGEDLGVVLARRGRLPVHEVIDYVLQACEAIAQSHAAGIVHRDLKPGNLFRCRAVDGMPVIKVLDFGISKLLPIAERRLGGRTSTGPHVIMGTPFYASPEQLHATGAVDARTDIWSLGTILYELLAGTPPFVGETFVEICAKAAYAPANPLHLLRSDVPATLSLVVDRCLAKDPAGRFQTVAELAEALAPFAHPQSLVSVARIETIAWNDNAATTPDRTLPEAAFVRSPPPPVEPTTRPRAGAFTRRFRVAAWSLGALGLAGALLVASSQIMPPPPVAASRTAHAPTALVLYAGLPSPRFEAPSDPTDPVPEATLTEPAIVLTSSAGTPRAARPAAARRATTADFGGML